MTFDEPLAKHTTFGIGGPADCMVFPKTREELSKLLKYAYQKKIKGGQIALRKANSLTYALKTMKNTYDEIKRQRKCKPTYASTIDGHSDDIPEYLSAKYKKLQWCRQTIELICLTSNQESITKQTFQAINVDLVTPKIIQCSATRLKPGKTDPLVRITFDRLENGPVILFKVLPAKLHY